MVTAERASADPVGYEIPEHRTVTPGVEGWTRTARPDDPNKYFMVSADCHVHEPVDLWERRVEERYRHRLPRIEVDEDGVRWQVTEGHRPTKIRDLKLAGEDLVRDKHGNAYPEERVSDMDRDGVDAEIIFPNKGLSMWATSDPVFANAMCSAWNDWAWETFGDTYDRSSPLACVATGDIPGAIAEIQRSAERGFRGFSFPAKPVWGPTGEDSRNYNLPEFDPLWAAVEETGLPITFHVSTGRDPRGARGNGGAVTNYVFHSLAMTMEPVINMCASGVFQRFPGLRAGTIEAGIGWIPWALTAMDEAYHKHHMWAFPKLEGLPSDYYRAHCFGSFQDDGPGIDLARKYDLIDNLLWANDYPHHEGSWPHSAAAIERTMGDLTDEERAKILGLNAARLFNFEVPEAKR
ncbi:MAG: amidohydrolase family protein [Chloroflexi bacterium]|nr:amidohydrolase family protein [Chloroflexota bacterium]